MTLPWRFLSPELAVCVWIVVMLAADLLIPASRKSSLWMLALLGIAVCAGLLTLQQSSGDVVAMPGMVIIDHFAGYFKGLFLLTTAVVIIMTREFQRHLPENLGAFYMLLFTALLGMFVLASMNDLLMLFLGLELLTFSLYVMTAYLKTDARSVEAGLKYLILGSVSSGFLVYGIALLYGATGSTSFSTIHAMAAGAHVPLPAQAGLLLVLAGLGFKVAAVPFNLWVPDVYEGAPTPVVAMLRVVYGLFLPLSWLWGNLFAALSAATLFYGNLAAIPQTNIKRLLGYSSIGHAGYVLMGLSSASLMGAQAVTYYLLAYLLSNLAVFLVVVSASDALGGDSLEAYNGLSKRSPFLAAALFIGLLSLAGVPPLAGFVGKLLVLYVTVESHRLWLVFIGAANVVISLYYYLMVVKRMYLVAPSSTVPIRVHPDTIGTLAFLLLGILLVEILQEPFLYRIASAIRP